MALVPVSLMSKTNSRSPGRRAAWALSMAARTSGMALNDARATAAQSPAQHVEPLRAMGIAMYTGNGGNLLVDPLLAGPNP